MPDALWWVQVVSGVLSAVLIGGAILSGIYTHARGTPNFVSRLIGLTSVEKKLDAVYANQKVGQHLQLQQAEAFNGLAETVCQQHDIEEPDRPAKMNTTAIREEVLGQDQLDFTRGGR